MGRVIHTLLMIQGPGETPIEGWRGRASEEVDFEVLSCAGLLTPEMSVLVLASKDSLECGESCGLAQAWTGVIKGEVRSQKGVLAQTDLCVFFAAPSLYFGKQMQGNEGTYPVSQSWDQNSGR